MIIHIWMHWFWITTIVFKGFLLSLSRHVFASSIVVEAGLPGASITPDGDHYLLINDKLLNYASQDDGNVEERWRRSVDEKEEEEEEVVEDVTTTMTAPVSNETMSNESTSAEGGDPYGGSSDTEDTYNGGSADGFQYPLKKYMKYGKYNKIKTKPKTTEELVSEVPVEIKAITEIAAKGAENATVSTTMINATEVTNQTVAEEHGEVNQTVSESTTRGSVEVESTSAGVVNATTEVHTSDDIVQVNLTVENKLDESVIHTTVEPFIFNNRVAAATSSESRERLSQPNLDAGSITGITLGIVVISGFIGAISFVLYRRRYLNKPQALNDKCSNLDSSGYIDDTSLRENSEEMYSLDNDSFLNSLEAMTIQNYWTENVKHTKL